MSQRSLSALSSCQREPQRLKRISKRFLPVASASFIRSLSGMGLSPQCGEKASFQTARGYGAGESSNWSTLAHFSFSRSQAGGFDGTRTMAGASAGNALPFWGHEPLGHRVPLVEQGRARLEREVLSGRFGESSELVRSLHPEQGTQLEFVDENAASP